MGKGIGVGAGGQRGLKSPHFHRKRAEPPYLSRPDKMIIIQYNYKIINNTVREAVCLSLATLATSLRGQVD